MFGKCKHQWEEQGRSFTAQVQNLEMGWSFDGGQMARELINGTTWIMLRCSKCGDVATRHLVGIYPAEPDTDQPK